MKNTLSLMPSPCGDGYVLRIGNPGGGHAMTLTHAQLLSLADWLEGLRQPNATLRFIAERTPHFVREA